MARPDDFDRRLRVASEPTPAQEAGVAELRKRVPGVEVQFDPVSGSASHLAVRGGFLTGPCAPANRTNDGFGEIVRRFIEENAAVFGHGSGVVRSSRITRGEVASHSGMQTLVWQQELDGVPLCDTVLKANLTRNGELVAIGSHFLRDPAEASGLSPEDRAALLSRPAVDVKKAICLAAADLGDAVEMAHIRCITDPEGPERRQHFESPRLGGMVAALTWLPLNENALRLAWDVTLMSLARKGMFRVLVDARTGEPILRVALTDDGSGAPARAD